MFIAGMLLFPFLLFRKSLPRKVFIRGCNTGSRCYEPTDS